MDTALVLKSIDTNGDTLTKTFAYVNPEVSNSDLKDFALKANSLTKNTYKAAYRVIKMSVDEEWQSGTQKPTPNLAFGLDAVSLRGGDEVIINYSYTGDAKHLYAYAEPGTVDYKLYLDNYQIVLTAPDVITTSRKGQLRIYSPQTTRFADKEYFLSYSLITGQPELPQPFSPQDIVDIFTDGTVQGGFSDDDLAYIFNDILPPETIIPAADVRYIFDEGSSDFSASDLNYVFSDGTASGGFSSPDLDYIFNDTLPPETILPAADINSIFD